MIALMRTVFAPDKERQRNFVLVHGKRGCGKSLAVYACVCLARHLGWNVLYIVRFLSFVSTLYPSCSLCLTTLAAL